MHYTLREVKGQSWGRTMLLTTVASVSQWSQALVLPALGSVAALLIL